MADEFLTVNEVAETLRINPQTVRNWIDRGELPALRAGARRVRIRRQDLEALISGQLEDPKASRSKRQKTRTPLADPDVITALREFGVAALGLAQALERARE